MNGAYKVTGGIPTARPVGQTKGPPAHRVLNKQNNLSKEQEHPGKHCVLYIYKGITRLLAAYPLRGRLDVPKTDPNTGPEEQPISNTTKPKSTSQGVQRRIKVPQHTIAHIAKHIERRAHTS